MHKILMAGAAMLALSTGAASAGCLLTYHATNDLQVYASQSDDSANGFVQQDRIVCVEKIDGRWQYVSFVSPDGYTRTGWLLDVEVTNGYTPKPRTVYVPVPTPPKTVYVPMPMAPPEPVYPRNYWVMKCNGLVMQYTGRQLFSVRDDGVTTFYPVERVQRDGAGLTVRGLTRYGRVAAFYSTSDSFPRIFWHSDKGDVVQGENGECTSIQTP